MVLSTERPAAARTTRPRTLPRPGWERTAAGLALLALLAAAGWSVVALRLNIATVIDSVGNAADFLSRTLPLDFPPLGRVLELCGLTLAIVVCATLLGVALSVPLALLAAGNTAPGPGPRYAARGVLAVIRVLPDVVLAIFFVRLIGLGAIPGVLALGLASVGMVGKFYADAVEQIDERPPAAVRTAGVSRSQELVSGVLPQVLAPFVGIALYRFDINLRISVILGFVGVGGLGFAIANALGRLDYARAMALAAIVIVLCVAIELVSGGVRRSLLGMPAARPRWITGWLPRRSSGPAAAARDRVSPPWTPRRIGRAAYVTVTVLIIAASIWGIDPSLSRLLTGFAELGHLLGLFWPPQTGGILGELLDSLVVTIQIALAGTLIGAVLALPVGSLAARNVAPSAGLAKALRVFIVLVRGIPELILAIVFVVITGLGPVAGAAALGIGAIGLLGKLVADSVEETDLRVAEAVRATGATRTQVFFGATVPQAAPAFVSNVTYQLDVNLRAATLLGIVGAGGIGFYLLKASRVLEFEVVTTIVLLVLVAVLAVELLALWLRRVVR